MGAPTENQASEDTGGNNRESFTTTPSPPRRARGVVGKAKSPKQRRSRRAKTIDEKSTVAEPKARPSHDTTRSARPLILAAARKTAARKGYELLQVQDITAEAGISHQAFYGHFANKRHVVAVATSDELGSVADLVMRGSKRSELWAQRLLDDIDKALIETYPSKEGPSQRLRRRLIKAIRSEGGYEALRIAELVKVSKVGHGEFYRRYGGKKGCLQRIYAEVLEEVEAEVSSRAAELDPLTAFGESLSSDPKRAELLILGASYLPAGPPPDQGVATREALFELAGSYVVADAQVTFSARTRDAITGALLEVVRSSVLSGETKALSGKIAVFRQAQWGIGESAETPELVAA